MNYWFASLCSFGIAQISSRLPNYGQVINKLISGFSTLSLKASGKRMSSIRVKIFQKTTICDCVGIFIEKKFSSRKTSIQKPPHVCARQRQHFCCLIFLLTDTNPFWHNKQLYLQSDFSGIFEPLFILWWCITWHHPHRGHEMYFSSYNVINGRKIVRRKLCSRHCEWIRK